MNSTIPCLLTLLLFGFSVTHAALSPDYRVERVGREPIIDATTFTSVGADGYKNINGPSCIRVPEWIAAADRADPAAQYYLYFGHHKGKAIRMAWAVDITGPWHLFNMGRNDDPRVAGEGVLDLGGAGKIGFESGVQVMGHIASPDVIIDEANRQFIMFFHGPANPKSRGSGPFDTQRQKTLVATSATGLNFNLPDGVGHGGVGGGEPGHGVRNAILGNAYYRVFQYAGDLYAFSNKGPIWKAPNPAKPWEGSESDPRKDAWDEQSQNVNPVNDDLSANYAVNGGQPPRHEAGGPDPANSAPRHFATLLQGDGKTLEVWYTSRGEMPERIFRTTMDLSAGTWEEDTWTTVVTDPQTVHQEMLRPELEWEGADLPLKLSRGGAKASVNQLRDPDLFRDVDGKIYLFYSGKGEEAIGLAEVIAQ